MFSFIKPFLFKLDPETAHNLVIQSLKLNYLPKTFFQVKNEEMLTADLFGKKFSNPIGLAAGFDKSAEIYNSIFKFGFGFVEVGTITPLKQYGNPKPRIFRLDKDEALINRLGFNNDGSQIIRDRILSNLPSGILGINIGPNKETENQKNDFLLCVKNFFDIADYLTINISSPNTEKLRDFHNDEKLISLIKSINLEKNKLKSTIPIMIKISPDINDDSIEKISEIAIENSINGIILTNTSSANRGNLNDIQKGESGGLSGKPMEAISNRLIRKFYKFLDKKVPIIGVGGVDSGKSAYKKILAGASLVQLYTGMIYKGPEIVKNIKKEFIKQLKNDGVKNFTEIIGQDTSSKF